MYVWVHAYVYQNKQLIYNESLIIVAFLFCFVCAFNFCHKWTQWILDSIILDSVIEFIALLRGLCAFFIYWYTKPEINKQVNVCLVDMAPRWNSSSQNYTRFAIQTCFIAAKRYVSLFLISDHQRDCVYFYFIYIERMNWIFQWPSSLIRFTDLAISMTIHSNAFDLMINIVWFPFWMIACVFKQNAHSSNWQLLFRSLLTFEMIFVI